MVAMLLQCSTLVCLTTYGMIRTGGRVACGIHSGRRPCRFLRACLVATLHIPPHQGYQKHAHGYSKLRLSAQNLRCSTALQSSVRYLYEALTRASRILKCGLVADSTADTRCGVNQLDDMNSLTVEQCSADT